MFYNTGLRIFVQTAEGEYRPRVLFDYIRLHRFRFSFAHARLNHVMFCLQSHKYIVQHKTFKKWTYVR